MLRLQQWGRLQLDDAGATRDRPQTPESDGVPAGWQRVLQHLPGTCTHPEPKPSELSSNGRGLAFKFVSALCFPGCAPRNRAEGLVWSFLRQEDGEAHAEASTSAASVSDRCVTLKPRCFSMLPWKQGGLAYSFSLLFSDVTSSSAKTEEASEKGAQIPSVAEESGAGKFALHSESNKNQSKTVYPFKISLEETTCHGCTHSESSSSFCCSQATCWAVLMRWRQ